MARKLAKSTLDRLRGRLLDEQERLAGLLAEHEREREEARLAESSSERTPDPTTAEGGTMAFEYVKAMSIDANTHDLLSKVDKALEAIEKGTYGTCTDCGKPIPVARLEALPYTTLCVECARNR